METLTMHPASQDQMEALKAIAKALKVPFETNNTDYNPEFVSEILKGEKARKDGKKGVRVDVDNLWK